MGGGLMQLVAYGAQDIYLTGNPQITFFKVVYRRHTNFSMEAIEQTWNGTVAASGRVTATISRNGDLVHKCYLASTLNAQNALNGPAQDLSTITCEIGGQQIDKHYGEWLEIWSELSEPNPGGQQCGTKYQMMSGIGAGVTCNTGVTASDLSADAGNLHDKSRFFGVPDLVSDVVSTPLMFWFCRNPGLALPLIALQYHEVKIIVEFASSLSGSTDYSLWVDYIYLDTDERRRFAQVSHEYLIEQIQRQSESTSTKFTLNFNHPVKELIWNGGWGSGANTAFTSWESGDTWKLTLNGHERFAARDTRYFTRTQVWQHHTGYGGFQAATQAAGQRLAVYSFALKPEEHQPSGTCNFSRIDNAVLETSRTTPANIFAVNYNVLRIMSGMGGLAYSN